jgi:hypothetical protein
LLGERFMTEEELTGALEDLAQEQIYQTFSWREGTYQFIGGEEALAGLRYKVSLKIESVLMEGARRADEWPRLRDKLPGPDVVVDMARDPDTHESDRTYRVLSQIQGLMRIGELLQRSRLPEYDVYEILAAAVDSGTVRIVEKPAVAPPIEEPGPRPARPAGPPRAAMLSLPRPLGWSLALGVSMLSALAAWQIAPRLANPSAHETARALDAEQAREMLRTNLEVYRALHGHYPASLSQLENAALASPVLLQRAAPLRYSLSAGWPIVPARRRGREADGDVAAWLCSDFDAVNGPKPPRPFSQCNTPRPTGCCPAPDHDSRPHRRVCCAHACPRLLFRAPPAGLDPGLEFLSDRPRRSCDPRAIPLVAPHGVHVGDGGRALGEPSRRCGIRSHQRQGLLLATRHLRAARLHHRGGVGDRCRLGHLGRDARRTGAHGCCLPRSAWLTACRRCGSPPGPGSM